MYFVGAKTKTKMKHRKKRDWNAFSTLGPINARLKQYTLYHKFFCTLSRISHIVNTFPSAQTLIKDLMIVSCLSSVSSLCGIQNSTYFDADIHIHIIYVYFQCMLHV